MASEKMRPGAEQGEPGPEAEVFERRKVTSHLEGPNGEHATLDVAVSKKDGTLKFTNFWDLDKTLLNAERFHFAAVDKIYPEFAKTPEDAEELHKFFFAGFALGNSFREWDRMRRICEEGKVQYKDSRVYEREFINDPEKRKMIDGAGQAEGWHEKANAILQHYGKIAYEIMEKEYKKDPEGFQKELVKPQTRDLLVAKTRMGQASVFMTANQVDFAKGLVTFSGLSKYGLALATDETMAKGKGGKEIAIEELIKELDAMGLKVNRKRALAAGDSPKGDVGSGTKTGLKYGILVADTSEDIANIREQEEFKNIFETTDVKNIATKEIKQSKSGRYLHGKKGSQEKSDK